jgi:chromosome segregation ATPase
MPPKSSSHGRSPAQTALLKQLGSSGNVVPDAQNLLAASITKVRSLEKKILELETALGTEQELSLTLSKQLTKSQDDYTSEKNLSAAHSAKCKDIYRLLRNERRTRQRGQERKLELEAKIDSLKSSSLELSAKLQNIIRNSSKTIDSLLKLEKEKSQLSKDLERATAETVLIQERLSQAGENLKKYRN